MTVILASGSATRRALLASAGIPFEVRVSGVDEDAVKRAGLPPEDTALALAGAKAAAVDAPGSVVVGADQMLLCDGRLFDKPADRAAARAQLLALRGRRHELLTATVVRRDGVVLWRHLARPALVMRAFSDAFLDGYLAAEGDALLGCVGAYRLEGLGIQLFDAVEGDHSAILGLPLLPLLGCLRALGILAV